MSAIIELILNWRTLIAFLLAAAVIVGVGFHDAASATVIFGACLIVVIVMEAAAKWLFVKKAGETRVTRVTRVRSPKPARPRIRKK